MLATPFEINGTGFDSFLENNEVIINNNNEITIVFKQSSGGAINIGVSTLGLDSDLTLAIDNPPSIPSSLSAYPQSVNSIIVRWKASIDDKGVAGYHVFRNGLLIATTPYPLYTDSGLSDSQNYQYQVQAIDSRNQLSDKTIQTALIKPSSNASISLDGSYDVVVTSTSTELYCSGAVGTFTLSGEEFITGSVTSITNSSYVFNLSGTRDKNTGAVSGGFANTQGITYASINGVIDTLYSNGTYSDIRGCTGVWVGTRN